MDDSPPVSTISGLLEGLARIDDKLARIERRLDHLEHAEQLPKLLAVVTDTVDQHVSGLQARGLDLEEHANNALKLLERITDARTTQLLTTLLELAEQAPNAFATLVDGFDQRAGALNERIDLKERASTLARIAERLTTPQALGVVATLIDHLPSLEQVLASGALGPGPIEIVSRAAEALTQAQRKPALLGPFGLLRALSDSDVQRSLGFAVAFARELGRSLEPGQPAPALPENARS